MDVVAKEADSAATELQRCAMKPRRAHSGNADISCKRHKMLAVRDGRPPFVSQLSVRLGGAVPG
jgi:hypothetical protein